MSTILPASMVACLAYGAIVEVHTSEGDIRYAKVIDDRGVVWWIQTSDPTKRITDRVMLALARTQRVSIPDIPSLQAVVPLDEPLPEGCDFMSDQSPGGYLYLKPRR